MSKSEVKCLRNLTVVKSPTVNVIILKGLKAEKSQSCKKPVVEKGFRQSFGVCYNTIVLPLPHYFTFM